LLDAGDDRADDRRLERGLRRGDVGTVNSGELQQAAVAVQPLLVSRGDLSAGRGRLDDD